MLVHDREVFAEAAVQAPGARWTMEDWLLIGQSLTVTSGGETSRCGHADAND